MAGKDHESLIGHDPSIRLNDPPDNEESSSSPNAITENVERQKVQAVDIEVSSNGEDALDDQPYLVDEFDENAYLQQNQQIVLEAVQNIQNVTQLHERLLDSLNRVNKIDIDASAVMTIDTATLQLLLVLKQTAIKMQKEVSIDFPSEKFIEAAELLGLAEMLDVDRAAAGFF